jgi:V-type H+-transporting ATPase subunit d
MTLTICYNCIGKKDIPNDEKVKLFPNFGELQDVHDKLKDCEDFDSILKNIERFSFHEILKNSEGGKNMETLLDKKFVELNKNSFYQQFHFGAFYSYVKLKEQEIKNLMWIAECIKQEQKHRINDNVIF